MKEITKVTVPGTTVTILIMKLVDGTIEVRRSGQDALIPPSSRKFVGDEDRHIATWARHLWVDTVDARDDNLHVIDQLTYVSFKHAIDARAYVVEVQFE